MTIPTSVSATAFFPAPAVRGRSSPHLLASGDASTTDRFGSILKGQQKNPAESAYAALGSVLLQKTIETMMPPAAGSGASTSAKSIWNSMLAQNLADCVSASLFRLPQSIADPKRDGGLT